MRGGSNRDGGEESNDDGGDLHFDGGGFGCGGVLRY